MRGGEDERMDEKRSEEEWFQAEELYYISLSIAKSMLKKGIIDDELLIIIDKKLLEKYRPASGMLLRRDPDSEKISN